MPAQVVYEERGALTGLGCRVHAWRPPLHCEEVGLSLRVLRSHGWSLAALARDFHLNWRTVKREVEAEEPLRYSERTNPTAPDRGPAGACGAAAGGVPRDPGSGAASGAEGGLRLPGQLPCLRPSRAPAAAGAGGPGDPLRDRSWQAGAGGLGPPGAVAAGRADGRAVRPGGDPGLQPAAGDPLVRTTSMPNSSVSVERSPRGQGSAMRAAQRSLHPAQLLRADLGPTSPRAVY